VRTEWLDEWKGKSTVEGGRIGVSPRGLDSVASIYRMSIKSLYNLKNLLQRQMRWQISGNYYKMRCMFLSFLASIWTPLVTQSTSRRYSISCHVRCSIPSSIVAMASVILCFQLVMSRTFVRFTMSLT
jgi:hypothetical protein